MGLIFNYEDDIPQEKEYLVEAFVDPGYELEYLDDVDRFYLRKIRERFEVRKEDYLSFAELRAALYDISNKHPKRRKADRFFIIHLIRRWWRAGEFRRFVKGRTRKKLLGRGAWYGVHYKIYPEGKNE